jgi:hypothetical protein
MSLNRDQLYALLPAIYRTRDAENGQPLYALFTLLAEQAALVEDNIKQLYDDQFIETCAPWAIPYIGDLVGSDTIVEIDEGAPGRRAEVANTIGYRRRKGTLLALEQVAMDVSGRPAMAVEFFKRLITTESMRHVRPHHDSTLNVRRFAVPELLDSPFAKANRIIDVRRIAPRLRTVADPDPMPLDVNLHGGGRFNIPDIGVYVWRWKSFAVTQQAAFTIDPQRSMFSPLGQNIPLFNASPVRESFASLTTRIDVPQPILRSELAANLAQFYGVGNSVALYGDGTLIPQQDICCRDLSDRADGSWGCTAAGMVSIDPVLGRIQFAQDYPLPEVLRVDYCYGFPANLGGGSYDRTQSLAGMATASLQLDAVVGQSATPTLEAAIAAWNALPPGSGGRITIPGPRTLTIDLTGEAAIVVPANSQLWIVAATATETNTYLYDESCVVLSGNIAMNANRGGGDDATIPPQGQLIVSGIWLAGSLAITGDAASIQLLDCTLVPGISLDSDGEPTSPGTASVACTASEVDFAMTRSIAGPLAMAVGGTTRICSSIIDASSPCGVAYAGADLDAEGADLHAEDCTIIGKVRVHTLELASNTIFHGQLAARDRWRSALWCARQQTGCVRFSVLPANAITPRRFECLAGGSAQAFYPSFVSLRYGDPSYCLLSGCVPTGVWTGADNSSQIGVYNFIQETEAIRNVQVRAQEYMPFELEAGVFLEPSVPEIARWRRWNPCVDEVQRDPVQVPRLPVDPQPVEEKAPEEAVPKTEADPLRDDKQEAATTSSEESLR